VRWNEVSRILFQSAVISIAHTLPSLAYAELYLAVAPIVLRFDFELFETTVDDVTWVFDGFSPFPSHGSKGIRVIVK